MKAMPKFKARPYFNNSRYSQDFDLSQLACEVDVGLEAFGEGRLNFNETKQYLLNLRYTGDYPSFALLLLTEALVELTNLRESIAKAKEKAKVARIARHSHTHLGELFGSTLLGLKEHV